MVPPHGRAAAKGRADAHHMVTTKLWENSIFHFCPTQPQVGQNPHLRRKRDAIQWKNLNHKKIDQICNCKQSSTSHANKKKNSKIEPGTETVT